MKMSGTAAALPLLRGYAPETILTWWQGRPMTCRHFASHAVALAGRLPAGGAVLNLCDDRSAFVLGWVAALVRGLPTILPADRTAKAVSQAIREGSAACALIDHASQRERCGSLPCLHIGYDAEVDAVHSELPEIPSGQIAAILYTSGSTGKPEPAVKHWGGLVSAARTLGDMLGWKLPQNGCVIGAVAPQHMFGLETTVMLPLQWGSAIRPERPLLPADLVNVLRTAETPSWLMVTPLHAESYVGAKISSAERGPAGIISSTMPLSRQTAITLEQAWKTPVWEIYGSTETGMIGLRRTAQTGNWRLSSDLLLDFSGSDAMISGRAGMPGQKLQDQLRPAGADGFMLLGRSSDLVKIGGKRAMLPQLNALLCSLPGVRDAVLVQPEEDGRLVALVVSDGRDAGSIRAELSRHLDPAFLPRPVWLVDRLPRNSNGKLPRQSLLDMIERLRR